MANTKRKRTSPAPKGRWPLRKIDDKLHSHEDIDSTDSDTEETVTRGKERSIASVSNSDDGPRGHTTNPEEGDPELPDVALRTSNLSQECIILSAEITQKLAQNLGSITVEQLQRVKRQMQELILSVGHAEGTYMECNVRGRVGRA